MCIAGSPATFVPPAPGARAHADCCASRAAACKSGRRRKQRAACGCKAAPQQATLIRASDAVGFGASEELELFLHSGRCGNRSASGRRSTKAPHPSRAECYVMPDAPLVVMHPGA